MAFYVAYILAVLGSQGIAVKCTAKLAYYYYGVTSTVQKKIAAVHFTTIPCEPYTANRHTGIESHILAKLFPELTTLCMQGLKFSVFQFEAISFRPPCVFMSGVKIFVRHPSFSLQWSNNNFCFFPRWYLDYLLSVYMTQRLSFAPKYFFREKRTSKVPVN